MLCISVQPRPVARQERVRSRQLPIEARQAFEYPRPVMFRQNPFPSRRTDGLDVSGKLGLKPTGSPASTRCGEYRVKRRIHAIDWQANGSHRRTWLKPDGRGRRGWKAVLARMTRSWVRDEQGRADMRPMRCEPGALGIQMPFFTSRTGRTQHRGVNPARNPEAQSVKLRRRTVSHQNHPGCLPERI